MLSAISFPSTNICASSVFAARGRSSFRIAASCTAIPPEQAASSLYDVLGLSIGADCNEIKAAYRRLARSCHPDVCKGPSSADEFMRIHAAYSTLSDPSKRTDYDRGILGGSRSRQRWTARTQSFPGYGRSRTWETDQCW